MMFAMVVRSFPLLLALAACRGQTEAPTPLDADGDGVAADTDCNDSDPAVFPGAIEVCNGVDDNWTGAHANSATSIREPDAGRAGHNRTRGIAAATGGAATPRGSLPERAACDQTAASFESAPAIQGRQPASKRT